ncbi:tapasin-related protein [Periophthalmus magnuspinnatus]|uniref:tapasin-related protein n=1 Tax=Periophthalmus magnuspinnatus TaxID=409849 RepID=UPI00145BF350|nr:tapasin-related protein [Periophthalmus magnuspinnatus]
MFLVVLLGYSVIHAYADDVPAVADVVLSCVLVEDGAAHGGGDGGMGAGGFSRSAATLVLRDVPAGPDQSLEGLTPFVPPRVIIPDVLIIEATVSSPDIPNSDVLLHADCNGKEVMCELSPFSPDPSRKSADQAFFMVSVSVDGEDFSTSLILRTIKVEQITQRHSRLGLPLSPSGTVQSEVAMVVFSHVKSLSGVLRDEVQLPCGFKQQDPPLAPDVQVTWRVQHRGRGRKILGLKTSLEDTQGPVIHAERRGAWVSAEQVVSEGNASLTLSDLKVEDEGTYICAVSIGKFHAQQVMLLNVIKLPEVSLSEDKLVLKSAKTLVCYSSKYYPLDAEIEWFSLGPDDSEPVAFPGKPSLSAHRSHGDGTFSVSSQLNVPPTVSPGTKITCTVSHPALDTPLSVSVMVEMPEPDSYWWILGFLIITVLFFLQVMK